MSGEAFGGFLAALVLVGFGYFIYSKLKKKSEDSSGSGGGGVKSTPDRQVEK